MADYSGFFKKMKDKKKEDKDKDKKEKARKMGRSEWQKRFKKGFKGK